MVPKNWNRLKELVSSLSRQEKGYFRNIAQASNVNPKESKLVALLDVFESELDQSSIDSFSRNRKLLELLEDRLLDSLLMDVNLSRRENETELLSLRLQKKFMKCQVLQQRAVMKRAFMLAGTCAVNAEQCEDYELALRCVRVQISMIALHKCEQDFQKLLGQIDRYDYWNQLKNRAVRLYRELKLKKYLQIEENIDMFVAGSLRNLNDFQKKIDSPTVNLIRIYFEKESQELSGNWQMALNLLKQIIAKCSEKDHQQNIFSAHELMAEQGRLCLRLENIDSARFFLTESIANLPLESDSHQEARELLFLLEHSRGNYSVCDHLLDIVTSRYFKDVLSVSLKVKWIFYHCCLLFVRGESSSCAKKIDEVYQVAKPAAEMNLHLRLMRVMCLIDREELDLADKEVESLRKFISRQELGDKTVALGLEGIFQMLWQLRYCGYRFADLADRGVQLCELMEERRKYRRGKSLQINIVSYLPWLQGKLTSPKAAKPLKPDTYAPYHKPFFSGGDDPAQSQWSS